MVTFHQALDIYRPDCIPFHDSSGTRWDDLALSGSTCHLRTWGTPQLLSTAMHRTTHSTASLLFLSGTFSMFHGHNTYHRSHFRISRMSFQLSIVTRWHRLLLAHNLIVHPWIGPALIYHSKFIAYVENISIILAKLTVIKTWSTSNSLWPSDAIWWHRSGSTLAQVMACCLTAPRHYLNQCWLIINEVQWHSY